MLKVCPKRSSTGFIHRSIFNSRGNSSISSLSFLPSPLFPIPFKTPFQIFIPPPPPLKFRTLNSAAVNNHSSGYHQTEVEVKLRLQNSHSHKKLTTLLSPFHTKTHFQENIFFDGPTSQLTSNLAVLRLRFYNHDSQCIISLKSKPTISSGISRVEEDEEAIDPSIGRSCVAEPSKMMMLLVDSSRIVKRVREEFGVGEEVGLVCLGGFKNVRGVYDWNGLKLEVDETEFDFGTSYEVECETEEPEKAKELMEELLKSNGIDYCYSQVSKFATFVSRKLPH